MVSGRAGAMGMSSIHYRYYTDKGLLQALRLMEPGNPESIKLVAELERRLAKPINKKFLDPLGQRDFDGYEKDTI